MPEILDFDITGGFVTVRTDDLKTTAFPTSAVWMVRTNVEQVSPVDYSITLQMRGDAQVSFFGPEEIVGALAGDLLHEMRTAAEHAKFPERVVVGEFIDMETWQRVTSLIDNRLLQLTRQHSQLEETVRVLSVRDRAAAELIDELRVEIARTAEMARNGIGEQNSRLLRVVDDFVDLRSKVRGMVDAVGQ